MQDVVIVIPVYKEDLAWYEQISLGRCFDVLGPYPIVFVAPEGKALDFGARYQSVPRVTFPASYFQSVAGYNALLLSPAFYERFRAYRKLLVYQLDAFVFSDQLAAFVALDYDWIGAPWTLGVRWQRVGGGPRRMLPCGNGGFSLRDVQACRRALAMHPDAVASGVPEDAYFSYVFFSDPSFRLAPVTVARRFSSEYDAERVWRKNGEKLPFGCHAWQKYSADFYVRAFRTVGYDLSQARRVMHAADRLHMVEMLHRFRTRRARRGEAALQGKRRTDNMPDETLPLASIIMPCWNGGRYLKESVASALAQTYPRLELVIADDGSDDAETKRVLDELARAGDPRIQVLRLPHGGPSAARNAAVRASHGVYILPLDSDDLIEPPYLAEAVEVLAQDRTVGMVFAQADFFGARTGPWQLGGYAEEEMLALNHIYISAVYRRADFDRIGGYDAELGAFEDWDFWLSMFDLGYHAVRLEPTYFHYRKHEGNVSLITKKVTPEEVAQNIDAVVRRHIPLYQKHVRAFAGDLRRILIRATARNIALENQLAGSWQWRAYEAENRWTKLGRQMPWEKLEKRYGSRVRELDGIAHPVRFAVGTLLLQAQLGCSDEEVLAQLEENPYMRAFAGLPDDRMKFPPGLMDYLHARITEPVLQEIAAML